MLKGGWLVSQNGIFILTMTLNGNLMLSFKNRNLIRWESKTSGRGERLVMEQNGNLVIYDKNKNIVWESGTTGRGEYLQLENEANLVVYDSNQIEIWSSGTDLSIFYFVGFF